jgi:hypothetical protein
MNADNRRCARVLAAATAALLACALTVSGCVADARPPEVSQLGEVISDLSLTLDVRDASGAEEYYEIKRDGSFGFGGGMDARFQRITWTTQLTADEMRSLRDLMKQHGWFNGELRSTNQPKDARYAAKASCDEGSLSKRIAGENDRIEPVRHALREIANRRLQTDLERQPKPSTQRPPATQP